MTSASLCRALVRRRWSLIAQRSWPPAVLLVCSPQGFALEVSICCGRGRYLFMQHGVRVIDEPGRDWRLTGSTSIYPDRTPLSPRATNNGNGANTPATSPNSNGRYMDSPSRGVTECARLRAERAPKTRTGKRTAVNSGARVRGSGGGSGKKRVRSRARARIRVGLQTQVEERFAEAEFDAQQAQARAEARLRKEEANAEADAEARRKAVSSDPARGPGIQTRGGKRRVSMPGSTGKTSRIKKCGKWECGWVPTSAGHQCNRCPEGVVHWAGDGLCAACHQPAGRTY